MYCVFYEITGFDFKLYSSAKGERCARGGGGVLGLSTSRLVSKTSPVIFCRVQVHRALVILEPVETDVESLKALVTLNNGELQTNGMGSRGDVF